MENASKNKPALHLGNYLRLHGMQEVIGSTPLSSTVYSHLFGWLFVFTRVAQDGLSQQAGTFVPFRFPTQKACVRHWLFITFFFVFLHCRFCTAGKFVAQAPNKFLPGLDNCIRKQLAGRQSSALFYF
jgi:hypothetical protein